MTSTETLLQNPFFTIQDKIIAIDHSNTNYSIAVDDVHSIYLSKRKINRFYILIGKILFIPKNTYDLHIKTTDNQEIRIGVNSVARQSFIKLITFVRGINKRN